MTVLKANMRPIIQVNALPGFIQLVTQKVKPTDVLEDKTESISTTMTPNTGSQYIRNEKPNCPYSKIPNVAFIKL